MIINKIQRLPEAPLRPEARGICHICHMVNPALSVCLSTLDLEKISSRHAVIGGINKIVDGPLFVSPSTVDTAAIH